MKRIEISKVLNLAEKKKYEVVCAAFDLADHIFKVDVPQSLRGRKSAIQAMSLLSSGRIRYGYYDPPPPPTPEDSLDEEGEVNEVEEVKEQEENKVF